MNRFKQMSFAQLVRGRRRQQRENNALRSEIETQRQKTEYWQRRCLKTEQNLRIFSSPGIVVKDFIDN